MKQAARFGGSLEKYLSRYKYQPVLTPKLDGLGPSRFNQETVNEIILWKVNRYARLEPQAFDAIESARDIRRRGAHREIAHALRTLLGQSGVDLPMASTSLRFRNQLPSKSLIGTPTELLLETIIHSIRHPA